jgi:hypothetical protein
MRYNTRRSVASIAEAIERDTSVTVTDVGTATLQLSA